MILILREEIMARKNKDTTETHIEGILRKYPESKAYIELHSEIKITSTVNETPIGTGRTGSKVETKAIKNIEPREVVLITEAVKKAATERENNFMDYRYFRDLSLADCSKWLNCSPQTVFRIRKGLLDKAKRIIYKQSKGGC
jgi:DNA-directed RNA polymerase specialized sigma subunit